MLKDRIVKEYLEKGKSLREIADEIRKETEKVKALSPKKEVK